MKKLCYVVFLLFLTVTSPSAIAQGTKLFLSEKPMERARENAVLSASAADVQKLRQERQNKRVDVVEINQNAFLSNVISVDLPNGKTLSIAKTGESQINGIRVWEGRSSGTEATFAMDGDVVSGRITDRTTSYEISFLRGRYHALKEIDPRGFPPDHAPEYPSDNKKQIPRSDRSDISPSQSNREFAAAAGTPDVAVLVVYTPGAALAMGSSLNANISRAISDMNVSFRSGGVNLTVSLAATLPILRDWATSQEALTGFSDLPSVRSARDTADADVVVLIGNFEDNCGRAPITASPTTAFAVTTVWRGCYLTNFSLAHEIGHLIGGDHDIANPTSGVVPVHPQARGHQIRVAEYTGTTPFYYCVHTIMAYAPAGCDVPYGRRNYWSNPGMTYELWYRDPPPYPSPHHHPLGVVGVSNMAAVLNSRGAIIARFGETKITASTATKVINIIHRILGFDDL